jgi:hypothetical protein
LPAAAFYDLDGTLVRTNLVHVLAFYARNDQGVLRSLRRTAATVSAMHRATRGHGPRSGAWPASIDLSVDRHVEPRAAPRTHAYQSHRDYLARCGHPQPHTNLGRLPGTLGPAATTAWDPGRGSGVAPMQVPSITSVRSTTSLMCPGERPVSRVLCRTDDIGPAMVIHLGDRLPGPSSDQPEG